MTPQLLDFDAPVTRSRPRRVDLVAAYFRERPGQWIDGMVIREFAGGYGGWSARIRQARREFGMRIENRVRVVRDHDLACPAHQAWDIEGACNCLRQRLYKISEYKFVPTVSAREGE